LLNTILAQLGHFTVESAPGAPFTADAVFGVGANAFNKT
jgi:hypothetical protein